MKIQILISKNSWANKYRNIIINKLKKYYKKVEILQTHKKLKKDYNIDRYVWKQPTNTQKN